MSIEIEIKAWIDDFETILKKLKENFEFVKEYYKEDIYLDGINSITKTREEVRIRKVCNEYIVTYKERSHIDKVEVNVEKEFNVDNKDNFLYLINKLGYYKYIEKVKEGFYFKSNNINIEISHVHNLGDFIEIEYIADDKKMVDFATNEIYKILDKLNITRDKIEEKYYVEMLKNKKMGI